LNSFNDNIDKL